MLKKLGQCFGLASMILVMSYGDLLGGGWDVRMHVPVALRAIVWAQLTDILLLGLLLFAVLWPLSRTRLYPWVKLLLAILTPPCLIYITRSQIELPLTDGVLLTIAMVWAAFVLTLLLAFKNLYSRLMRLGDFVGAFFGVFCVCSVLQLLWIPHWKPGPQEHTPGTQGRQTAWATTPQPPRVHPRMVWILFDELSFDQVYGDRAAGLALPNFDALRNQSTVYTDVQPIGDRTARILPSLITGRVITDYEYTFHNHFLIHTRGMHGFTRMDPSEGVFSDAQKYGWRTAVVGWYNPYCTYLAGTIDDCYWADEDRLDGPMALDASFWGNVWSPLKQTALQLTFPRLADENICTYGVRQRYKTYMDLRQHAFQVLRTDQADFLFLHLPVPHSPNIWNRRRGSYTQQCGSSYLDSLALADRELGQILTLLKSSPRWKDTTLIVEGDHSWRIYLWKGQPAWTAEDAYASRSGFDPRPAVIVHHAGQTRGEIHSTPWSLLNVHALVEQVLHGGTGD